jgi:trigger factor
MAFKVEKIENSTATIKIEVGAEDFSKAIDKAYAKNKSKYRMDGFRKGKVPRAMLEMRYGKGVFYEDGIDEAFPEEYLKILESGEVTVASRPYMVSIDEVDSETGFKLTIQVALKPEVTLGDYNEVTVKALKYTAKEKEAKEELESMREKNARLLESDAPSKKGDTVIIDFEGFVDGEAFEGGKAEGYSLEIGSNSFIPGFEDQLIGKKAGEAVDVNVTFPEQYTPQLAGKDATFKVVVHEVKQKELPVLDDEFAQEVSEFDTLDELKKDIKAKIKARKEEELKTQAQNQVIETAIANSTVVISELQIDERAEAYKKDFERQLQQNGIDPEAYFGQEDNDGVKEILDKIRQDSIDRIKGEYVVEKMVEAEGVVVTDKDVEEIVEKYSALYNIPLEDLKNRMDHESTEAFRDEAKTAKLLDKVMAYVKVEKKPAAKKAQPKKAKETEKKPAPKATKEKVKKNEETQNTEEE